jgi:hypothetical protein
MLNLIREIKPEEATEIRINFAANTTEYLKIKK